MTNPSFSVAFLLVYLIMQVMYKYILVNISNNKNVSRKNIKIFFIPAYPQSGLCVNI